MNFKNQYFLDKKDAELSFNFKRLFIRTFLLIILFLVILFLINYNQKREVNTGELVAHTNEIILQSTKTISFVKDYETSARGFILSNDERFLEPARNVKDSLGFYIGALKELVSDNEAQTNTVDSFENYIRQRIIISDSSIRLRKDSSLQVASAYVSEGFGQRAMDTIRILERKIQQRENVVLFQRKQANSTAKLINRVTLALCLLLFFVLLLILFWQAWFNLKKYNDRQKEVNTILRQLATSLQNAQGLAHIGSWESDINTKEERWSDEQFRIFGYEPGSVQMTHDLFMQAVHPADRERVAATIQHSLEATTGYKMQFRIIQPSGRVRYVKALGEVLTVKDKTAAINGTMQDITEEWEKEKEKDRLLLLLDKTNEVARIGWWEADVQRNTQRWSDIIKQILELPYTFEPGSDSYIRFIKDDTCKALLENAFKEAIINATSYDNVIPFVTLTGKSINVRVIGEPFFDGEGQCVKVFGVFQQIN